MTAKVLKTFSDIDTARTELRNMGGSALTPHLLTILRNLGLLGGLNVGDPLKGWDILTTAKFLIEHLPKTASVLDIGAYRSEILISLYRLGFRSLAGVDLNPEVRKMPHASTIRYEVSDFMTTPFPEGSFDAVTAISVIEHGFAPDRLLRELSRVLRPGGYFIASFDYWPEKIDTAGQKFFDMEWTIFSRDEVLAFVETARKYGFQPAGDLSLDAGERVANFGGKRYTFGWLALQKTG